MIVALEGIDASGKATQSKLLAKALRASLYSFPAYNTPVGSMILKHLKREVSLCGWNVVSEKPEGRKEIPLEDLRHMDALMFQSLQFTNRMELQEALQACSRLGTNVVLDRYTGSSLAYGAADGLDWKYLKSTQSCLLQPDYNIYIDIPPEESAKRRPDRRDRYEANWEFLENVRHAYLWVWDECGRLPESTKWVVIDGMKPVEEVHFAIMHAIGAWKENSLEP